MKKLLLIPLLLLSISSVIADDLTEQPTITGLDLDKTQQSVKPNIKRYETGMYYFKIGKSLLNSPNHKKSGSTLSIGKRQYSNEFLYGAEYSRHDFKQFVADGYNVMMGYQPMWFESKLPYAIFSFGFADAKDKPLSKKYSGFTNSIDIGSIFSKNTSPFIFFGGVKYSFYNLSGLSSVVTQDLYIGLGFDF